MFVDLRDMWHQRYFVSPQREGELELNPASDCDNVVDRDLRDYTSVIREFSLWILIRDSLSPPDILYQRIAGKGWNNLKLYGKFVVLWFFLMTKKEEAPTSPLPEWPSICFNYRQNLYDLIALENHNYAATKAERIQN